MPLIPMIIELIAMGHEVTYFANRIVLPLVQPLGCKVMVYDDFTPAYPPRPLSDSNALLPGLLEYFKYVSNFSQV
jgi:hypothetical protein